MQIEKIKSTADNATPIENSQNLKKFIVQHFQSLGNCFVLCYFHDEVRFLTFIDGIFSSAVDDKLQPNHIKEIRVFSENGELYIWQNAGKLSYRLRVDNIGDEEIETYRESYFMWGNKVEAKKPNEIFEENRGMHLQLPFAIKQNQLPLKYSVRNYYAFDKNGLISIKDARLMNIHFQDGTPISLTKVEAI